MTDELSPAATWEIANAFADAANGGVFLYVTELSDEDKKTLIAQLYGARTPDNTIVILRGDDSSRRRHGGAIQYIRSFEAYVNAVKVQTWSDDSPHHDYASDEYLDDRIDKWGKTWASALGCKVVRGELRGRTKLLPESKR